MSKDEYIKAIETVNKEISIANDLLLSYKTRRLNIKEDYKKSECSFIEGEKVEVITKGKPEICYISRIYTEDSGGFKFEFLQSKKDGSMSQRRAYFFGMIESINKIETVNV